MQRTNRDQSVCPCSARISAIFVLRASAHIETLPKAGHACAQIGCVGSIGTDGLKEAPIGKLSALLVLDACPSIGPHRVKGRYAAITVKNSKGIVRKGS